MTNTLQKRANRAFNKLWRNRNSKQRSFLLIVLLPTLLGAIYYSFIAADIYTVEARFAIKGSEMQQVDLLSGLAGIPGQGGNSSDSYIVQDYINSIDIVRSLQSQIDLDKFFNHPNADWLSSLGDNTTQEEKLTYWRKRVNVSFDPTTTVITLRVGAFDPFDAQMLTKTIISQSELLVNSLSGRAREDDLHFANNEVALAEARVTKARLKMNEFRRNVRDLDPTQTATSKMLLIGQLETQLAQANTELNEILRYMNHIAPEAIRAQGKVESLRNQIASEKQNLTDSDLGDTAITGIFAGYEPLLVEREFAEKAYASALASLEAARVEASRKHRYLATFVEPTMPEDAMEPHRIKSIATLFIGALLTWMISVLGIGVIKEHLGWV